MIIKALTSARKSAGWTQQQLAERAGITRMTVQRIESGQIDPRVSTLEVMARALGLQLMPVPETLRAELEGFVRAGGRVLGQPPGVSAPPSIAQTL